MESRRSKSPLEKRMPVSNIMDYYSPEEYDKVNLRRDVSIRKHTSNLYEFLRSLPRCINTRKYVEFWADKVMKYEIDQLPRVWFDWEYGKGSVFYLKEDDSEGENKKIDLEDVIKVISYDSKKKYFEKMSPEYFHSSFKSKRLWEFWKKIATGMYKEEIGELKLFKSPYPESEVMYDHGNWDKLFDELSEYQNSKFTSQLRNWELLVYNREYLSKNRWLYRSMVPSTYYLMESGSVRGEDEEIWEGIIDRESKGEKLMIDIYNNYLENVVCLIGDVNYCLCLLSTRFNMMGGVMSIIDKEGKYLLERSDSSKDWKNEKMPAKICTIEFGGYIDDVYGFRENFYISFYRGEIEFEKKPCVVMESDEITLSLLRELFMI